MTFRPIGSYSVAMVAELWGVSDTFVYEQVKFGKLKAFKLGNKLLRIKPEWLEEYEAAQQMAAPEPVVQPEPDNTAAIRSHMRLVRSANRTNR